MALKKTTTTLPAQAGEAKKDIKPLKFLISPLMSEKASRQSSANIYTFVVTKNATKGLLMSEIKKEYKVTPKDINIINLPKRNTFVRGKKGYQSGIKKALVFLKKGDTIKLS